MLLPQSSFLHGVTSDSDPGAKPAASPATLYRALATFSSRLYRPTSRPQTHSSPIDGKDGVATATKASSSACKLVKQSETMVKAREVTSNLEGFDNVSPKGLTMRVHTHSV